MLEGEGHDVLDSLDRGGQRVSGKALADDNLNAANVVSRPPVVLVQQFAAKVRKSQTLELACLCELCYRRLVPFKLVWEDIIDEPHVVVIRWGPLTSRSRTVDLDARQCTHRPRGSRV
jgi:hypothetical protein